MRTTARAEGALIVITDQRIIVAEGPRTLMALPFAAIRRAELNVEVGQPATLTIVPDSPSNPPQILSVVTTDYAKAAEAVATIGEQLNRTTR